MELVLKSKLLLLLLEKKLEQKVVGNHYKVSIKHLHTALANLKLGSVLTGVFTQATQNP